LNGNDSVLNNVVLPLKVAGMSKKLREQKAMEALETVELADKASVRSADLSGGQKQRVCIARALINDPSIIFADEPTGNLDSATGEKVVDLLFRMNREKDITLIIVTHDSDLAARCQRRLEIKDGKLVGGDK
jgi:putative ABC transport system ATP-binding protein